MADSKHFIFSTTQIAATLNNLLLLYGIIARTYDLPALLLSDAETEAIAALIVPIVGNLWIQYRRLKPQKNLHFKKPEIEVL